MFNFLRDCQAIFQSGYTILHSCQQSTRIPVSSHPFPQLLLSVFLIIGILVGMKWHLLVVLICIFLMTNDVKHLLMCLLAIHISSLVKCLFKSIVYLKIGLFVFFFLSCESSLYSEYKTSIRIMTYKYFLPVCGLPFHFLSSVF